MLSSGASFKTMMGTLVLGRLSSRLIYHENAYLSGEAPMSGSKKVVREKYKAATFEFF